MLCLSSLPKYEENYFLTNLYATENKRNYRTENLLHFNH